MQMRGQMEGKARYRNKASDPLVNGMDYTERVRDAEKSTTLVNGMDYAERAKDVGKILFRGIAFYL